MHMHTALNKIYPIRETNGIIPFAFKPVQIIIFLNNCAQLLEMKNADDTRTRIVCGAHGVGAPTPTWELAAQYQRKSKVYVNSGLYQCHLGPKQAASPGFHFLICIRKGLGSSE